MSQDPNSSIRWLPLAALAVAVVAAGTLVVVGGIAGSLAGSLAGALATPSSGVFNVDTIPTHARQWATWVIRAGWICPQITPPLLAAQIEQESNWRADAVARNPPERGGDAMGIAQFQAGTWQTWGADSDGDGTNSPFDPEDAIWAQGRLMCNLVAWAKRGLAAGTLRGDPVDLALAGYFCGRACLAAHGGVPAGGLAHDYPAQVRARVATYSLTATVPAGAWTLPLPKGSYAIVSGFGMRWGRLHAGVDFSARTGTPIYAVAAGVVLDAGCSSPFCDRPGELDTRGNPTTPGCGLRVNVNHGGGIVTRYCHAVRLAVTPGQLVAPGQLLGWVGSTGHSTGPHLHFEVHLHAPPAHNGNAIDPLPLLHGVGLDP